MRVRPPTAWNLSLILWFGGRGFEPVRDEFRADMNRDERSAARKLRPPLWRAPSVMGKLLPQTDGRLSADVVGKVGCGRKRTVRGRQSLQITDPRCRYAIESSMAAKHSVRHNQIYMANA